MAPVVTMETARAKNNSDRRFVTKNWILCFMNDVSRVFPGWVLENFKLLLPESLLDTRTWGWAGPLKCRFARREWRARKQRVVPNFCVTRPSIRYVNYAYGNLDTTVPRCLFGSGPAVALMGGVLDGRKRSEQPATGFP